jgi:hypothetical protein
LNSWQHANEFGRQDREHSRASIAGRNKHSTESFRGWHGYAHYGACRLSAQHGDAAQHQVNRVSRIARSKLLAIGGHTALPISFRLLVALVPSGICKSAEGLAFSSGGKEKVQ